MVPEIMAPITNSVKNVTEQQANKISNSIPNAMLMPRNATGKPRATHHRLSLAEYINIRRTGARAFTR